MILDRVFSAEDSRRISIDISGISSGLCSEEKTPDKMTSSLAIVPPDKVLIRRIPHVANKQKVTFVLPDLRKK